MVSRFSTCMYPKIDFAFRVIVGFNSDIEPGTWHPTDHPRTSRINASQRSENRILRLHTSGCLEKVHKEVSADSNLRSAPRYHRELPGRTLWGIAHWHKPCTLSHLQSYSTQLSFVWISYLFCSFLCFWATVANAELSAMFVVSTHLLHHVRFQLQIKFNLLLPRVMCPYWLSTSSSWITDPCLVVRLDILPSVVVMMGFLR